MANPSPNAQVNAGQWGPGGVAGAVGRAPIPGTSTPSTTGTAASAHHMLISVGLELAFVVVATMLAGISDSWATGVLTLMVALLVLRGLFQVNLFGNFVNNNPLTPNRGTNQQQQGAATHTAFV
jgi:hypothetical protein